jgi:hypothetical protein
MSRWQRSRFDDAMEDPQTSLVNLVDIMLVFICGLVVALVSASRQDQSGAEGQTDASAASRGQQIVQTGRELAELPEGLRGQQAGEGLQPMGQVFKDPKTGKLILVGP